MSRFTARQKADAALRELRQRQWVYTRLVADGKKTPEAAEIGIALMEEIWREYNTIAVAEERAGRLL